MEQIAQSQAYFLYGAPLYWWGVGLFACGIMGLVGCAVTALMLAFNTAKKEPSHE